MGELNDSIQEYVKHTAQGIVDKSRLFDKLRAEGERLHLLSPDATDQTAFITVRDILNAHAQDKSFEHRYPNRTKTDSGTPYEIPSNHV